MTSLVPNTDHNTLAQSQGPSGIPPGVPLGDMEMSRSATLHSDEHPLNLKQESTMGTTDLEKSGDGVSRPNVLASLPTARKHFLTLCFCLSMFIDAAGVSAIFIMTSPISHPDELNIAINDQAWVLASYSMCFAALLLLAGRLADLYPPHIVYLTGFVGLAVLNLIISFMEDQYAFLVLRALSAILAVLTIPSSINMLIQMWPDPTEQAKKLALFGMAGALANTIALVLAGVFLLSSWRWYFRFTTMLILPFAIVAWYIIPKTEAVAQSLPGWEKIKRMDLGGVVILFATLVLFILGFTQAPIEGWDSAIFIAPLVISLVLFVVFLFWEMKMPKGYSLLPHDIWSYPNIFPIILQASSVFMWFATAQLRIASYFQEALGDSAILAAVKLLPMGITALFVGVATQAVPTLITRPKYIQFISSALCFCGSMLFAFSKGGDGSNYWKYMFTGQIIGTVGAMIIFIGMQTNLIQSFPIEFAGIGGSFAQIIFQVGGVIGVAIQAGLISTGDGTLEDWTGSKNGYFFTSGYILLTGFIFMLWYKQEKMPERSGPVAAH